LYIICIRYSTSQKIKSIFQTMQPVKTVATLILCSVRSNWGSTMMAHAEVQCKAIQPHQNDFWPEADNYVNLWFF
jgi:predicted GTPase